MGTLIRAFFGFAIAYAVYAPHSFAAYFETPRMVAVKAELAETHPGADLRHVLEGAVRRLPEARTD